MRRSLSIIGGLVLAAFFSQFPEYAQQYEQRLGGAVDELRIIVNEFDTAANAFGLDRNAALARYAAISDDFIRGRGISMAQIISRYETLSATLADIQGATGWERFNHLPKYFDSDVGRRALESYRPAIPVTVEGAVYAVAGFMLGYLVMSGLVRFLLLPFRRRTPRTA
jgi:hypothetical protein